MAEIPNVCLNLSNGPDSLLVVHEALSGVAEILGLDALETDDLRTVAAEACKNVVYHAYEGQEGPLEVEVYTLAGAVEVVVRDHGIGIRPHVGERTQPHTGIGLPIVHVLSQRVVYSNLPGGGTEVRMQLGIPRVVSLATAPAAAGPARRTAEESERANTVELALAPSALAAVVLRRVLGAMAARAGFSAARAADVGGLGEALAASACESSGAGHLRIELEAAPRSLALCAGPLCAGTGQAVLACVTAGLTAPVERLLEEQRITPSEKGELVVLRLRERD